MRIGVIAVSYTHLDVYKRQAEDCGSGVCRGNDFVWMCVWFESRA